MNTQRPDDTQPAPDQHLRPLHADDDKVRALLRALHAGHDNGASARPASAAPECNGRQAHAPRSWTACRFRRLLSWVAVDAALVIAAYSAVLVGRAVASPLDHSLRPELGAFILGALLVMQYAFGVYHRLWMSSSGYEIEILFKAVGAATLLTLAVRALPSPAARCPISVVLLGNTLALGGFITVRYRGRLLSGFSWRWRAIWFREFPARHTRVLIVGAGELGQATARRLKHSAPQGAHYHVVGLVDDDAAKRGMYVEGCEVLGDSRAIPALVRQHQVELVVVALRAAPAAQFRQILTYCEASEARIKVVPDIFDVLSRDHAAPFLRDINAEDFLGRMPIERHPAVDLSPVTRKTILVTGAAGSIGSELARQLLAFEPLRLVLLDNNESALHDLATDLMRQHPARADQIVPLLGDITNRVEMSRVFARHKPQVVFHAAAYKHVPMMECYPNKALQTNVNGTRWVAELARFHGVERFVLISSDKAVCPSSVMGATKRIGELLMLALSRQGTRFTAVRFGNVLGSRGSVVPTFNRQIEDGGPVTITDRNMRRYFMTISEACNLVIHAACLTEGGDLFMLNMGDEVAIVDLAERMIRARGLRPYVDIAIKFTGMRPGEKLREALSSPSEQTQRTVHPDILQLVAPGLELDSRLFLARLDKLQSLQFCEDERLRRPLLALAELDHTLPLPDELVKTVPARPAAWPLASGAAQRAAPHTPQSS